jgi:hypothetical protein
MDAEILLNNILAAALRSLSAEAESISIPSINASSSSLFNVNGGISKSASKAYPTPAVP